MTLWGLWLLKASFIGALVWRGKRRNRCSFLGSLLGVSLPGSGEKAKPRPKVVDSGSLSELDAKSVFRFFPGASVGSPKSFRGFRLFPRQGLRGMVEGGIGPFVNLFESYEQEKASEGLWDSYRAGGEKGKHAFKRQREPTSFESSTFDAVFLFHRRRTVPAPPLEAQVPVALSPVSSHHYRDDQPYSKLPVRLDPRSP